MIVELRRWPRWLRDTHVRAHPKVIGFGIERVLASPDASRLDVARHVECLNSTFRPPLDAEQRVAAVLRLRECLDAIDDAATGVLLSDGVDDDGREHTGERICLSGMAALAAAPAPPPPVVTSPSVSADEGRDASPRTVLDAAPAPAASPRASPAASPAASPLASPPPAKPPSATTSLSAASPSAALPSATSPSAATSPEDRASPASQAIRVPRHDALTPSPRADSDELFEPPRVCAAVAPPLASPPLGSPRTTPPTTPPTGALPEDDERDGRPSWLDEASTLLRDNVPARPAPEPASPPPEPPTPHETTAIVVDGKVALALVGRLPPVLLSALAAQRTFVVQVDGHRVPLTRHAGVVRVGAYAVDVASYRDARYAAEKIVVKSLLPARGDVLRRHRVLAQARR